MAISLQNTLIDDSRDDGGPVASRRWYYGCGMATLAMLDGEPVGLFYDDPPHLDAPTMKETLVEHNETRYGMVSCWEFCD